LYELSLKQNSDLKTFNAQIAERMQERDEDLAASYEEIERKSRTILKLVVAVILLCVPYLVKLALWTAGKFRT
jgi:cytochrome c-type biogenesis protein CcmH/NrfG